MASGLGGVLTTPHRKNISRYEMFTQGNCEGGNEPSGSII